MNQPLIDKNNIPRPEKVPPPNGAKSSGNESGPVLPSRADEIRELNEVKAQLEEAKNILEIRTNAKTKALRDLASGLEEEVKARTQELRQKVEESENSRMALMNMLEDMEDLRRRSEEEKEKTLAIITDLADGLMFFDARDRLALINPRMESFFGITRVESKNMTGQGIAECFRAPKLKLLGKLMGGGLANVSRKELFLDEKNVFEISVSEVAGHTGKIGTILLAHDISREKMVEKMKTEFVSIAAHQLRTPISAIKWTLRMILDGDLGPINEEQEEFLDKTYKSNERMINLINDLLNVTRIEEGRHLYTLAIADMEEVVAGLMVNYEDIARQKKLKLSFEKISPIIPPVKVDLEKIKLVVSNLIENALKYTPAGGNIFVTLGEEEGMVFFEVKDTGIGIPDEQQNRIFTKYFRGANAIKAETEGTGLGLFIAKNIVETHGGSIGFVSKKDEGTAFSFTLPPAQDPLIEA